MAAVSSNPRELIDVADGAVERAFHAPALFLSASIPFSKPAADLDHDAARIAKNAEHVRTARPDRIRDAIVHLCDAAFARGYQLVFGGHPAISPLVLDAARAHASNVARADAAAHPAVIVFQSMYFEAAIGDATRRFADWSHGLLVWTASSPASNGHSAREASLLHMRTRMTAANELQAAIFIGGMDGVLDEAALFRGAQPTRPCYALGSTGAAAEELLDTSPGQYCGRGLPPELLQARGSYPLLYKRIFDDIEATS